MKNKGLFRIISLILTGIMLCACTDTKDNVEIYSNNMDSDKVVINFYGNINSTEKVRPLEELISKYMKENPNVVVIYEGLEPSVKLNYNDLLVKRLAANSDVDVFLSYPGFLPTLVKKGYVQDLSKLKSIDNYSSKTRDSITLDGKYYGLPLERTVIALYCNKTVLKENGVTIPEDYDGFLEACEKLKENGVQPIGASNLIPTAGYAMANALGKIYRSKDCDKIIEKLRNGEEDMGAYFEDGFVELKYLVDSGYINGAESLQNDTTENVEKQFANGEVAFLLGASDLNASIVSNNENVDYEIVPIPVRNQKSVVMYTAAHMLCIGKNSGNMEEAESFVEFCTRPENINTFVNMQGSISPLAEAAVDTSGKMGKVIERLNNGEGIPAVDYRLGFRTQNWAQLAGIKLLETGDVDVARDYLNDMIAEELDS